jgi:phenylalanyl-tRNA synthetase beta chain
LTGRTYLYDDQVSRDVPVIRFDAEDLARLMGRKIPTKELAERLPMIGGDLDKVEGSQVTIEFFPNRPDLLSVEGVARAAKAFFDVRHGLTEYSVNKAQDEVRIEPSVARIRPHIAFARVTGIKLDDARLKDLIDLQERLTMGLGRKRKRVAIGIHDAKDVRPPFTYTAVDRNLHPFVPLGHEQEMTPAQILERHEKGRAYAHLLEGFKRVPLITDADGHVLSLPPVINGRRTQLTTQTRDVLVDVTGTDKAAVEGTLNIVVTALAERGGKIHGVRHVKGKRSWVAPDLAPATWKLKRKEAEGLLGIPLSDKDAALYLGRMGHRIVSSNKATWTIQVGAWRVDVLHPVDLIEEIAIGYGFEAFQERLPELAMFGGQRAAALTAQRARTALLGHGFTEVVTLTLTGRADHFEGVGAAAGPVVEVTNPVTQEQAILRTRLLPGLLGILRANKRNPLPQAVFEVGNVVSIDTDSGETHNRLAAAAVRIASRSSFADAKGAALAIARDLGLDVRVESGRADGFVEGRTGILMGANGRLGAFGEIHPRTLAHFELEAPAYGIEIELDPRPTTG